MEAGRGLDHLLTYSQLLQLEAEAKGRHDPNTGSPCNDASGRQVRGHAAISKGHFMIILRYVGFVKFCTATKTVRIFYNVQLIQYGNRNPVRDDSCLVKTSTKGRSI